MAELKWNFPGDPTTIHADVTRVVCSPTEKIVHFKGWASDVAKEYSDAVRFGLHTGQQRIESTYGLNGERVKYLLMGRFTDDTLSNFKGTWSEAGQDGVFEFLETEND